MPCEKILYGEKLPVLFTQKEKVMLSLDDIEDLMGYVAAEANHTDDKKLQNTLDKIFNRLNDYLSKYDDQE